MYDDDDLDERDDDEPLEPPDTYAPRGGLTGETFVPGYRPEGYRTWDRNYEPTEADFEMPDGINYEFLGYAREDWRAAQRRARGVLPADGLTQPERSPMAIEDIWVEQAKGILAGMDKDGKSTHGTELAVSLATGTPLWGIEQFQVKSDPAPVLVIQAENDDGLAGWMLGEIRAARGLKSLNNLRVMPQREAIEFSLTSEADRGWLQDAIRTEGYRYVFLDPIYELIGDADVSDRSGDIPAVTRYLTKLQTLGCAPIITNLNGDSKLDVRSMFGSKFWRHWLECAVIMRRRKSDNTWTLKAIADRHGYGERTFLLQGLGVGRWKLRTDADERSTERGPDKKTSRQQAVREYVRANPKTSLQQLADEFKVSVKTVGRDLKELKINLRDET